jgi:hypothetical protein
MLLRWGTARADEQGEKIWIKATEGGLSLYKRFGWKELDELKMDTRPYGGKGEKRIVFMCRESVGHRTES